MTILKKKVVAEEIPPDEEDIELKDPITKEKMVVEGEHFDLNRELQKREKDPIRDGEGNILSDRVVAELMKSYCSIPAETYNGLPKAEFKTWEDKTGLTCELQTYRGEKEEDYQEIRVSYNTKLYGDVIRRLREAKKTGTLL